MRIVNLPKTDLNASVLCLGVGDMGAGITRADSFRMLDIFLSKEGNFLDTAKIYSDWIPGETSRSEKLLGAWMKERGNRGKIVLGTKGAHPELASMNTPRLSPAEIKSDLEASLRHLQTETIDLYWLHRDDPSRSIGEIIETLHSLSLSGMIRYYGCSNWSLGRIQSAQKYAADHGMVGFSAVQNLWNLAYINPGSFADPTIEIMDDALWDYHRENTLSAVPYTSQANGFFQKLAIADEESLPSNLKAWYLNPVSLSRFNKLQELSLHTGLSTTQIVLGYLTSQPFPTFPIIGPKSVTQLDDCLTAGDVRLSAEEIMKLISR